MKPNKIILGIILFLGVFSFIGFFILDGATTHGVVTSDEFSNAMTGDDYSEFSKKVEDLKVSAEDDGALAIYKIGKAVYSVITSSLSQITSIINNMLGFIEIPVELVTLFITLIIVAAIFGGIKYFKNG